MNEVTKEPTTLIERLEWLERAYRQTVEALGELRQDTRMDMEALSHVVGVPLPSQVADPPTQRHAHAVLGPRFGG